MYLLILNTMLVLKSIKERATMEDQLKLDVAGVLAMEQALTLDPKFQEFLALQKKINDQATEVWQRVQTAMIDNDIKQLKGDFGTITVAERIDFDIDETLLPKKYFVKSPNTTLIRDTYRLEGNPVKGTAPKFKKYIVKKIK